MLKSKRESAKIKVLNVDDEPDICFLFDKILRKRNLTTGYANNLAEATSCLKADPPSLIFLDNSLPDGQGVDFIPYLKAHYPGTRVVMVTAKCFSRSATFPRWACDEDLVQYRQAPPYQ